MASKIKQALLKCISESVSSKTFLENFGKSKSEIALARASDDILLGQLHFSTRNSTADLHFNEISCNKSKIIEAGASKQINITDIHENGENLSFQINVQDFIKEILTKSPTDLHHLPEKKKLVIEFSSPNIAKEFHVGHLRSTIIGNFIANLKKKLGNDVVKTNYLGDWGTQFGLLIIGMKLLGLTDESLKSDTIQKLNDAYVLANRKARKDEEIYENAREIFQKLENCDSEMMDMWTKIRDYSKNDLLVWYDRLNIHFDEFEWESSYSKKRGEPFIRNLEEKGLLMEDGLGRMVVKIDDEEVPLLKSDGTTLYLLRDIIAYFDRRWSFASTLYINSVPGEIHAITVFFRRSRHNFDNIYYVVDTGQAGHFENFKRICDRIECNSSAPFHHVKFGRVTNLSTRKGTSVLLRDVLEEAEERMYAKILATETTKGTPSRETAGILGTGAIIVNDLGRFRKTQYEFNWEKAIRLTGRTGVQLQYSHCRLHSLREICGINVPEYCDPDALLEPEAIQLILDISRYEEVLLEADNTLESCYLVSYLFDLMKSINKAIKVLNVKNSASHLGGQRLLLFESARKVMAEGLTLLGVRVLNQM